MSALRIVTTTRQLTACSNALRTTNVSRLNCRNYATPVPPVQNARQSSTVKLALIGATIGAVGGSVYTFYSDWADKNAHKELERFTPAVIDSFPKDVKFTKSYVSDTDNSNLDIVLFQFQTCPFCCKVRAYLDFMGYSYRVVEVDAVLRQDLKWSKYKKVPMVLVRPKDAGDEKYIQLTDSSTIISVLASYTLNRNQNIEELANYYPNISFFDDQGKKQSDVMNKYFLMYKETKPNLTKDDQEFERKWRNWADHHLVHLISPNCYRSFGESIETFNWFSDAGEWHIHFPSWERNLMVYAGAVAMWGISKMLVKKHNLTDDVRGHIYQALNSLTKELKVRNTQFLGGKTPNLADISIFGVLNSMEGCQAFKDCLDNTEIGTWFFSMRELITKNRGQLIRERIDGKMIES